MRAHPSRRSILADQILHNAELGDFVTAPHTSGTNLIVLYKQISILPADTKHILKYLDRYDIRIAFEHRQIFFCLSIWGFLN